MTPPHDDQQGRPGGPLSEVGDGEGCATRYRTGLPDQPDATRRSESPPVGPGTGATRSPEPAADPAATNYANAPPPEGEDGTDHGTAAGPRAAPLTPTGGEVTAPASATLPRRFGGYELLGRLGQGGMGVVYKARQVEPERLVALKMIRAGELASEADVRRFRLEANEAARLDHPHITPVYEVGECRGQHFFTMKLVEGGSLAGHLDRYRDDLRAAARLVATVAQAVHHAHQRQILHRDLKPSNILLDAQGQPHVADFGLAKRLSGVGEASQSAGAGTPEYMAPEQARGDARLTTAADVYGLGGILYALLAGRPPFRGASPWETMEQVLCRAPSPPSAHRPGCPRDLETVCLKCLQKEPAKRYGSAEALADDLERWLAGEPVQARPAGRVERGWLWCRRNPALAGLLAAFLAALLTGSALLAWFAVGWRAELTKEREALQKLQDQEGQTGRAHDQLVALLSRSLLRPLGQESERVTDAEIEALWDLARSDPPVRRRFAEQALRRAETARQLRNRADMALHAAVGLAPAHGREIERAIRDQLRDPTNDLAFREECVWIGLALEVRSPGFSADASRLAVEAVGKTTDPRTLHELVKAVAALAPELGDQDASGAARRAQAEMTETTNPLVLGSLAEVEAALAPRLREADAADAVWPALERLSRMADPDNLPDLPDRKEVGAQPQGATGRARTDDPGLRRALARQVMALAPRLNEEAAARAAGRALAAMKKATNAEALPSLAGALAALAPRLRREEAAGQTAEAAGVVLLAMGQTTDPDALRRLAGALTALAPWLQEAPAADAARSVINTLARTAYPGPRRSPEDAIHLDEETTPDETSDRDPRRALAESVAVLATRLGPAPASAATRLALRRLAEPTADPSALRYWTVALAGLVPRLGREEAAQQATEAVRLTLAAMRRPADPDRVVRSGPDDLGPGAERPAAVSAAAEVVAALAPWLPEAEARAASRLTVEAMGKNPDAEALSSLAVAVAALAPGPGQGRAGSEAPQAAGLVLDAMTKTTDPEALHALARGLSALGRRGGTSEQAGRAVRLTLDAMDRTANPFALRSLGGAVAVLAPWLEGDQGAKAARLVLGRMAETTDPATLRSLAGAVEVLAPRLDVGEATKAARLLVGLMGTTTDPDVLSSLSRAMNALASGRFTENELVDLLKMPTCQRPARDAILRQLGNQSGRRFVNAWEFVEWARKYRPDLDLTTPPERGARP